MPRPFDECRREEIRLRLLEAGRSALPVTGMRRTPVAALAAAAGISKGGFYLFFPSREDLWAELAHAGQTARRVAVRAALHQGPLEGVAAAVVRGVLDDPVLGALLDPAEAAWAAEVLPGEALTAARPDDDGFFGQIYDGLVERGLARPGRAAVLTGLPLLAHGLAAQRARAGARLGALADVLVAGAVRALARP